MDGPTPKQLIEELYPQAAKSLSPLMELIYNNPQCREEILSLAMVIGICAAHQRLEDDRRYSVTGSIRDLMQGRNRDIMGITD